MKNIHILFFGRLKDTWATTKMDWQTTAINVNELYAELLQKANETPHKESIKVAINDEFCEWNSTIHDADTVAFLPPASGG
jgi:molybdopterin converting factor small subunit